MKTTIKIFYLILFVLTLQIISLAQDLRFAVTDGVSLNSQDGVENFTKLINTINQFEDLDFVVFNNIKSELKFNDRETQNLIRKISPPVYFMPSQYEFLFDRGAREKFYETFGEFNFSRNLDSLKILGLSSVVSWTPDPFFEREVFNLLKSAKKNNLKPAVLILNNSPTEIKNFDQAVELLDSTKIDFILAPLNSNRTIEKDRITLVNSKNNQRRSEAIKVISLNSDTLNVITHRLDGSLIDQEKIVIKGRAFTERNTDTTYDPDKLEKWSFDLGYSLASKINVNNERIYAADVSGQVVCLNTNGKKLWEYFSFGYIYSSPIVSDNYLSIATIQGDLETIDARNGKQLQSLGFDSPITSDLASFDFNGPINLMIPKQTKSKAAVLIGTENGELFCYDLETLQEHWRFDEADGAIVGKPLYVKEHVIFYSLDGYIYALNSATGLLTWKAKLTGKNEKKIYASDPVTNNENIYITLSNGKLFSFNVLLGKKNWEYDKYNLTTSLNISEDGRLLYAKSSADRFHILSAELGTWVKEIYTKIGKHYTNSDITETNDDIYFGNDVGFVYHIDSKYRINKLYRKTNSTIHSIKIIDKDKLIIASHDGIISLLNLGK